MEIVLKFGMLEVRLLVELTLFYHYSIDFMTIGSTPSFRMPSSENNIMMSWSKDGKYIAIGNRNDYVSIYDAIAGRLIKKFKYPLQVLYLIDLFSFFF